MNGNDGQIANDEGTNNNVVFGDNNAQAGIDGAAATNGGEPARSRAPTPAARRSASDGLAVNGANTGGAAQNNGDGGQALADASKGIVFNNNNSAPSLDGWDSRYRRSRHLRRRC